MTCALPSSIQALHAAWLDETLSLEALYQHLHAAIVADAHLGIWLAITPIEALLASARALDAIPPLARQDALTRSPLLGVPVGVKDNICTRALPTTAASRMLTGYRSPFDAEVVSRLHSAGAIVVGKANMDEFGMGSSGARSAFGRTLHPDHHAHVPGGSSSGSAAALVARHCLVTLGSDTGGSVRQPAAYCGVWGLKPTYGRVSRRGLIAHASSLDHIGPLATNPDDLRLIFDTIAGHDPLDPTSSSRPVEPASTTTGDRLRLGVPAEMWSAEGCPAPMRGHLERVLATFHDVELVPLSLPHVAHASSVYAVISAAEASSNLARYDGVRFGQRGDHAATLTEMYRATRTAGFGEEVRRRILLGSFVLSDDAFDTHMMKAQRVRSLIARDLTQALSRCDLIISPVTSTTAPRHDAPAPLMCERFARDTPTVLANLAGLPAMSFPCGPLEGLPVGMQLIGPHFSEHTLMACAVRLHTDSERAS